MSILCFVTHSGELRTFIESSYVQGHQESYQKRRTVSNPRLQNLTLRKNPVKEAQCIEAITFGDRLSAPASETFEATNKRYTCSRLVILEVLVGGLIS